MSFAQRIEAIDALLPQTQCGKCGHPGCRPYAEGIAAGEAINHCPPGGEETVAALAQLLQRPVLPLAEAPVPPQIAFIREAECIGCTKCIQACPTDAILGAAKLMHTVITSECTGCELCVAPCPVDCIDLLPLAPAAGLQQRQRADHFRRRYQSRQARLARREAKRKAERSALETIGGNARPAMPGAEDLSRQLKIDAAMARIALTKAERQLAAHGTQALAEQVAVLRQASETAQAALATSQSTVALPDASEMKKAKIAAAMSRAQLAKAEKAFGATPTPDQHDQLNALRVAATKAQRELDRYQTRL